MLRQKILRRLKQDFNALDAQREACEALIRRQRGEGWRLAAQATGRSRLRIRRLGRHRLTLVRCPQTEPPSRQIENRAPAWRPNRRRARSPVRIRCREARETPSIPAIPAEKAAIP